MNSLQRQIIVKNNKITQYTKLGNVVLTSIVSAIHAVDLEHVFIGGGFTNGGVEWNHEYVY